MNRSASRGFTFVELLIVVVVLGILASIALPRLGALSDKARLASLKADVRNAESAEESYYSDYNTYATLPQLESSTTYAISANSAMTVTLTPGGYTLKETNSAITAGPNSCRVQVGASSTGIGTGVISCP